MRHQIGLTLPVVATAPEASRRRRSDSRRGWRPVQRRGRSPHGSARRTWAEEDLRHRLRSRGLAIAALGCPLRHGLNVQENLEVRISHVKKVMTLAYDLGPHLVVLYPGMLPAEPDRPERLLLTQSLSELGRYGERVGSTLVLEMGQESPADWAAYLQGFTSGGLGINIDPANLVACATSRQRPCKRSMRSCAAIRPCTGRRTRSAWEWGDGDSPGAWRRGLDGFPGCADRGGLRGLADGPGG